MSPVPVATALEAIASTSSTSRAAAEPTMSTIVSWPPTSWKWTWEGERRWTFPSAFARAAKAAIARSRTRPARVLVVTAGTADLPVAEECALTLEAYGFAPRLLVDCGVAGVHRLLASVEALQEADAVIVAAGMEGALASVVGGLTGAPVVAVPTSVGYGSSLEGVTALLAMLSSCAAGIAVVGIDNGYGAACAVARLLP